jgi:hypothetical protein
VAVNPPRHPTTSAPRFEYAAKSRQDPAEGAPVCSIFSANLLKPAREPDLSCGEGKTSEYAYPEIVSGVRAADEARPG